MELFHHNFGQGKPVVILHGLFGVSDNWVSIGKKLSNNFSVYIPDLRNHGRSPHHPVFSYPAMVDDLYDFLEENELDDIILIGHSMGGKLAMNFCMEYPGMVSKLIIIDIPPREFPARQSHIQVLNAMQNMDFDKVSSRSDVEEALATTITSQSLRLFIMKNLYRVNKDRFAWRLNVEAITSNIDNVMEGVPKLQEYIKPALFVRGALSDYILDEDKESILSYFPQAKFADIPEAGHWVHADNPDDLCKVFNTFLGSSCI